MTQQPSEPLTPYAPLPVRARGTLEIFDTAFKLFRRYAGVLLAWSAISSLINLIPVLGPMAYLFTMPLMFGAVSCVVAGAVRGQNVSFKQIWGFTKPRYGAMLGVLILATIFMSLVGVALLIVGGMGVALLAAVASGFGWFVTAVAWVVGTIGGLIGASFLLAVLMGWFNLSPIIACLEDDQRGTNSLSRAWLLLKGNWRKACGVATILTLAGLAGLTIIFGFILFFFSGGWDKFIGADVSFLTGLEFSAFSMLFFMAWTPLQGVVGAIFYLDLRTRKEALDLEWTNYASKPETLPGQEAPAPAFSPAPPTPMGNPPSAPPSSLPTVPTLINGNPVQVPVFSAQSPAQRVPGEAATDVASVPATPTPAVPVAPAAPVADSFADFAAQMEAPQNVTPAPPVPTDVTAMAPPAISPAPPVVVQGEPTFSEPAVVALETATATGETTPGEAVSSFVPNSPTTSPGTIAPEPGVTTPVTVAATPPVPVPVSPPPAPIPIVAEPAAEPSQTSSFAPPPRFRRAASEEDDYPSSFGGSGR